MSNPKKKPIKKYYHNHVVFLGESGFPLGLATIQRITLMGKAFISAGIKSTVICRKGVWRKNRKIRFDKIGKYEGINYAYTSKDIYKPESFIDRNLQKVKGIYGEFKYLRYLNRDVGIDIIIVSEMNIIHIIRYYLYAFLLQIPVASNLTEMASSMHHRTIFFNRLNDYLHDKLIIRLFDGALPISDQLMDFYRTISPSKPKMKLPILCDFDKFKQPKSIEIEPYFLYCGSIGYHQVIDFIIDAYQTFAKYHDAKLYMIISGGSNIEVMNLEIKINSLFNDKPVVLFSNISYEHLIQLYINAIALLIPLRPTLQDTSRFPHKIGEYLATGNPIITTNVGEIRNYFRDGSTAYIAERYDKDLFAEKMRYVLENPEQAKKVGQNGKQMGFEEFHYKMHGRRLKEFLMALSHH